MIESLNEKWSYSLDKKKWTNCELPFAFDKMRDGDKLYAKRHVRIKPEKEKRYFVIFRNLAGKAKIKVNGHSAGESVFLSGDTVLDMTPFIKPANEISVQFEPGEFFYGGTVIDGAFFKTVEETLIEKSNVECFESGGISVVAMKYEIRSFSQRRKMVKIVNKFCENEYGREFLLDPGLNRMEYFMTFENGNFIKQKDLKTEIYSGDIIEDSCDNRLYGEIPGGVSEQECNMISVLEEILDSEEKNGIDIKTLLTLGEHYLKRAHGKNMHISQIFRFDSDNIDCCCRFSKEYICRLRDFGVLRRVIFMLNEKDGDYREFLSEFAGRIDARMPVEFLFTE